MLSAPGSTTLCPEGGYPNTPSTDCDFMLEKSQHSARRSACSSTDTRVGHCLGRQEMIND